MTQESGQAPSAEEVKTKLPERVEFKNSRGEILVGDLRRADSKAVVIMSHGLTADRHERGLFDLAAPQINEQGFNVLNYDFSASGESQGEITKPSLWTEDLISAVKFAKENGFKHIALLGMSFGGYVSARAYPSVAPDISTVVLWMPVVDKKPHPETRWDEDTQRELRETGKATIRDQSMFKKELFVSQEFFDVWSTVDTEQLLTPIKVPTIIIHGENDELVLPQGSKKGIKFLPQGSELEMVPGAGHGYKRMGEKGPQQFIDLTNSWLNDHLSK